MQASYTAGYMGTFVTGMALGAIIADGTGYYYPPYVGWYGAYPVYYPYAATYGYHYGLQPVHRRLWLRRIGLRSLRRAGALGSFLQSLHRNLRARSDALPVRGDRPHAAQAYNPYTGAYGADPSKLERLRLVGTTRSTARTEHTTYTQHQTTAQRHGSHGLQQQGRRSGGDQHKYGNSAAAKTSNGDMYASHDGNVYKNTGSGWQTYNNGSWNNVQKPTQQSAEPAHPQATTDANNYKSSGGCGEANQEAQSRAQGDASTQHYDQSQHSGYGSSDGWGSHSGGGGWASQGDSGGWGGGGDHWGGGGGGGFVVAAAVGGFGGGGFRR